MINQVKRRDQLTRLILHGYKSIANCDLTLGRTNILIGANGAGKSNVIGFFRLINRLLARQLQMAVGVAGGPDALLHFGRKKTSLLNAELYFGDSGYRLTLGPTEDNRMMFHKEALWSDGQADLDLSSGHFESLTENQKSETEIYQRILAAMRTWHPYHFHDTSATALVKQIHNINDNEYLREDASNLAAFLLRLKNHHQEHYQRIVKTVRLVAPFFGGFHLRATVENKDKIQLEWTEQGHDEPFPASALSDGTLRFVCLATVLLQPETFMPATVLIDEPELGLHPFAVTILAALIRSASEKHQLIISTQSVELVSEFTPEDLIVVDKHGGATTFSRPDTETLSEWLCDYSLGELWKKNLLGGRPGR